MIKLRRTLLKGLLAASVGTAMLGAASANAAEVTLRMHQFLPAQANVPKNILYPWADKVEQDSDGRIEIQRFPSMQLGGKPPELVDQAIDGVADIVWTVAGYTPGRFPRAEVFELPFTMTNAEAVSRAYWQLAEETMMDQDFKDLKILGVWVHGPGLIHSKSPVEKLEDLNGVKLRAPTRITTGMFKILGATPVGMPVPAVPEALSKGVIDAAVIPWEVTQALKVNELVKNHTSFGDDALYTTAFIFAMNKDRYNALPDDLKAVIDANSGVEFSASAGKQMQADDAGSRQVALDGGNNEIVLSEEEVAKWKAAAQPAIDNWIAEMDGKGLDGTGLRARALELIAENTDN
ncbi:trap dicarboxylate transporter, dctp subunit [Roseibium sp. TrichSKD4]|uniref:TRAP transporter substrate-binding protein n=1 Tax=Roseibium sp. TrichSKD4 TaxID=744980 RepID=UPI0001E56E36|nr:TRAP transporter substrate-binding protein [Roseibium sp. TrichSKD4]EFO30295.1 trap dicarboxylate transporter, dctp subunit [Roseibium sp. TrichSKD4]